jgi:T4 gene Gp59 loader of gp41 DNA helicase
MTEYEVYIDYLALKKHFTSNSFDYFKYYGKVKASISSYEKRRDKIFYQKISKHQDPHHFLLANLLHNSSSWPQGIAYSPEAESIYQDWVSVTKSLFFKFSQDLGKLDPDFNSNFKVGGYEFSQHPPLLGMYIRKEISLETLCILVKITGCRKNWKKACPDPIMMETLLKIKKYTPFIQFDQEKFKRRIVDEFLVKT